MRKAVNERRHAKKRCLERYGFEPTIAEMKHIAKCIQDNKAIFIDRQSNRVTRWTLNVRGQDLLIVYDKLRKQIITVL